MKKAYITITIIALTTQIGILAGEKKMFLIDFEEIDRLNRTTMANLARLADVAGVGRFINQPSTNDAIAQVFVDEWWTASMTNNTLEIDFGLVKKGSEWVGIDTDFIIPTNVPVVFFSMKPTNFVTNGFEDIIHYMDKDEREEFLIEIAESELLSFPGGDRAWFEKTTDNGLLYAYATNIWETLRTNPNPTNYYNVLCAADNITREESFRIFCDNSSALDDFHKNSSTDFLVEKYNERTWPSGVKASIANILQNWPYCWTRTNDVWVAP